MTIYATAGSKLYIGGVLPMKSADFVEADFTSQTWKEVGGLESLGTLGDTSQAITQSIIGEGRDKEALVIDVRFNGGGMLHDQLATLFTGDVTADFFSRDGFHAGGR